MRVALVEVGHRLDKPAIDSPVEVIIACIGVRNGVEAEIGLNKSFVMVEPVF